ncbi:MAG: phosphate ABC transporter permease PstA [Actinobacteria bacterium]|nr:phosphate ABC transporter permease PstA [Actinomycetota bacterium]
MSSQLETLGHEERSRSYDPAAPLTPSGNLRRRQLFSRLTEQLATAAAIAAIAVLVIVVYSVIARGAGAISWDFITKSAPVGVAPALVGSAIIVAIGTLIATPIGILIGLFLTEYAGGRTAALVSLTMDVMNGLPAIIIGLFIFTLLVSVKGTFGLGQSAYAAGVALSIIMLPLIARGTQGVLRLIPKGQSEAADALGVARWRTVLSVILPSALGGILTVTILSVARAAGETAPVLLVSSIGPIDHVSLNPFEAIANSPTRIYTLSEEANPAGFTEAWGLSLLLISFILFASLGARALLARSKGKRSS